MYGKYCSMKYSWLFAMSHSQSMVSNRLTAMTKNRNGTTPSRIHSDCEQHVECFEQAGFSQLQTSQVIVLYRGRLYCVRTSSNISSP